MNDTNANVSKVNPFAKKDDDSSESPKEQSPVVLPPSNQQIAVLYQQLASTQERVTALETQLTNSEKGRREDSERLLREMSDLKAQLARAELELELRRSGKLPPEQNP